ncbi:MAG: class II aldolase/adducin family protein [Dehalococcoidia bacterium]|nr:class II aldolase/adducin family protein [Dehalococcoidia bacterium]
MADAAPDVFLAAGRMLWEAGLVSSHGGNMSVRLPDGGLLVTRTGSMLGRLGDGDLVVVAADGSSAGEPSMDTALHRVVYEASGTGAVLHAHPRHAITLSLAMDVIEPADAEGLLRLGAVPVVEAEGVAEALRDAPIVMARGHGSYARGDDLWQALQWTSVLEESAQVLWLLRAVNL